MMLAHIFFPRRKSRPLPPLILSGHPGGVSEAEVMVQHVRGRTLGFFGVARVGGANVPGNRMCGRGTRQKCWTQRGGGEPGSASVRGWTGLD